MRVAARQAEEDGGGRAVGLGRGPRGCEATPGERQQDPGPGSVGEALEGDDDGDRDQPIDGPHGPRRERGSAEAQGELAVGLPEVPRPEGDAGQHHHRNRRDPADGCGWLGGCGRGGRGHEPASSSFRVETMVRISSLRVDHAVSVPLTKTSADCAVLDDRKVRDELLWRKGERPRCPSRPKAVVNGCGFGDLPGRRRVVALGIEHRLEHRGGIARGRLRRQRGDLRAVLAEDEDRLGVRRLHPARLGRQCHAAQAGRLAGDRLGLIGDRRSDPWHAEGEEAHPRDDQQCADPLAGTIVDLHGVSSECVGHRRPVPGLVAVEGVPYVPAAGSTRGSRRRSTRLVIAAMPTVDVEPCGWPVYKSTRIGSLSRPRPGCGRADQEEAGGEDQGQDPLDQRGSAADPRGVSGLRQAEVR